MLSAMTTRLAWALFLVLALSAAGCDGDGPGSDAGGGGSDAGGGGSDAGGGGTDAGGGADAGGGTDGGGGTDAGGTTDAGGGGACPCFGATEIAAIEAHAAGGGTRGCMTGVMSGNVTTGALSSSEGAQVNQVDVSEIVGFAGTDWTCASGCSDINDDTMDDCLGAPLPAYSTMIVTEAQHDACEALIAAACM